MYSSELYFKSVNSIYLFNQKTGHKSLSGLHSLGSGGASSGANHGVSDRSLKMHGRWVTDRSKDGYIKDNLESQMAVSVHP
jgi:hypothetical protein